MSLPPCGWMRIAIRQATVLRFELPDLLSAFNSVFDSGDLVEWVAHALGSTGAQPWHSAEFLRQRHRLTHNRRGGSAESRSEQEPSRRQWAVRSDMISQGRRLLLGAIESTPCRPGGASTSPGAYLCSIRMLHQSRSWHVDREVECSECDCTPIGDASAGPMS